MATKQQRGADALIHSLKQSGVTRIFTLSGNHIMPVFDAAFSAGIELIHTRHEAATVHMADAYARITGEPGIALVTGGPGHANAISALYTAQMAESPVVLLSGHAPNNQLGMGAFQEMRQADMASPVTKRSWTSASADSLATDMMTAIAVACSGRPGPIHVSLPTDALEQTVSDSNLSANYPAFTSEPQPLSAQDAATFLTRLSRAKRPLILTGPASLTRARRHSLTALEAATGIAVVGMESPRGIGDPSLGAFAQMLAQSDCVLLLGKRLDFTLKFGAATAFAADCEFLQIDAEHQEIERSQRAVGSRLIATAQADAPQAVQALINASRSVSPPSIAWRDDVRAAIAYRPDAWNHASSSITERLHPVQALRPLQTFLDSHPDSVFISDGGEIGQWAQACLNAPHRVINGVAGAIGAALPFALGARVALPNAPIVAVMGDGTFGFHCAEMDTAVRHGLPFVAVVGNDARWNAEYQIQLRDYGRDRLIGCELLPSRYDEITAAFGGHGEYVTSADTLIPAAERAIASGKPSCINVMIEGLPAPNIRR
ncbi:MAG: thiamine pyrophosphate-binding protein [Casimicrobium sp.]